uniref:C2H2-type domain-containing protein n=1 Tax=Opuntia streptacantha TaxID=393608 RepID=A0A7C9E460_OPUST
MMMKGFGLDESIMSNLTSTLSGETSISSNTRNESSSTNTNNTMLQPQVSTASFASPNQGQLPPPHPSPAKKRRSLPGNPDPDAEVIALSPKSLLATNRFVCEICNKGFQRDQNLQLHRRGHNLPWKLKQRANKEQIRKKVYVCPEPTCVHHDPSRALGDLTGIKKHFCRKHGEKKWKCDKCSKKYAVQSDWKAHSKICGTREYRCDCGTLFSRRDSFITHRAFCDALAAAEESGRYDNQSLSSPSPHLLQSLSSLKRAPPPSHVGFPPWLSSPSSSLLVPPSLPPQQAGPYLFASVDDCGGPTSLLPQMSATALLQKAAEMGVTLMSSATPHQEAAHVTSSSSGVCSSRDQGQSSSVLHDMMIINSLQSTSASGPGGAGGFDGGLGFGDHHDDQMMMHHQHNNNQGHQGATTSVAAGKPPMPPFHGGGGSRRGGGDGLSTRDFLGLRTFSHKDFINMAGLGAQINSSSNSAPSFHHHHQHQPQLHHDHQQQHNHDGQQNQTPW